MYRGHVPRNSYFMSNMKGKLSVIKNVTKMRFSIKILSLFMRMIYNSIVVFKVEILMLL